MEVTRKRRASNMVLLQERSDKRDIWTEELWTPSNTNLYICEAVPSFLSFKPVIGYVAKNCEASGLIRVRSSKGSKE